MIKREIHNPLGTALSGGDVYPNVEWEDFFENIYDNHSHCIDRTVTLTAATTIDADEMIEVIPNRGLIDLAGNTLTFNGTLIAGRWQVFTDSIGGGSVAGKIKCTALFPEWWGATTNDASDDSQPAIQAAIDHADGAGGHTVSLGVGTYYIGSQIQIHTGLTIKGENRYRSILQYNGDGDEHVIYANGYTEGYGVYEVALENFSLSGTTSEYMIYHTEGIFTAGGNYGAKRWKIENMFISGGTSGGIHAGGLQGFRVIDCYIQGGGGGSVSIDNAAVVDNGDDTVGIKATGHTLHYNDTVQIAGTTNYNGNYVVESVSGDYFNITDTYVAETIPADATASISFKWYSAGINIERIGTTTRITGCLIINHADGIRSGTLDIQDSSNHLQGNNYGRRILSGDYTAIMPASEGSKRAAFYFGTYILNYVSRTSAFLADQTVTGSSSGHTAVIERVVDDTSTNGTLYLSSKTGAFINGETITSATGSATASGTATSKAPYVAIVGEYPSQGYEYNEIADRGRVSVIPTQRAKVKIHGKGISRTSGTSQQPEDFVTGYHYISDEGRRNSNCYFPEAYMCVANGEPGDWVMMDRRMIYGKQIAYEADEYYTNGSTSAVDLATTTVPKNTLGIYPSVRTGGGLLIRGWGNLSGGNGTKTINVTLANSGGTALTIPILAATNFVGKDFEFEIKMNLSTTTSYWTVCWQMTVKDSWNFLTYVTPYTVTNLTASHSLDCTGATTAQVAHVLGTLINELRSVTGSHDWVKGDVLTNTTVTETQDIEVKLTATTAHASDNIILNGWCVERF